MTAANYIPGTNPFKLAGPPKWWLIQLADFDPSLVVVPSKQDCVYRLAQRRHLKLPEHIVNDALFNQSDTQMLASYSLVPVTTIIATANWSNPTMWKDLAERAPWRQGGAEKVNALLDQRDLDRESAKQQATEAHLTSLGKDGWNLYRKKIGLGRTIFHR